MSDITLTQVFTNIANAIRQKEGSTNPIPATEFADRIEGISKDLFVEIATGTVTSIKGNRLKGLTSIPAYAFTGCYNLTSITIPSNITSINKTAFSECSKLTTINVSQSEGVLADAPWGATNATINYNYGGE